VGQTLVEAEKKASYRLPPGPLVVNTMLPFRLLALTMEVQTRISAMHMSSMRAYRNHGANTASHSHGMALRLTLVAMCGASRPRRVGNVHDPKIGRSRPPSSEWTKVLMKARLNTVNVTRPRWYKVSQAPKYRQLGRATRT